jgi:hypothetical protein
MSVSKYRAALDNAWAVATNRANTMDYMERQVTMWLSIADMERRDPANKDDKDSFHWGPRPERDPSVVGVRCSSCRHFVDNHGFDGLVLSCRECSCSLST